MLRRKGGRDQTKQYIKNNLQQPKEIAMFIM